MPGLQDVPAQAEVLERTWRERLHRHVEPRQQLRENLAPARDFQIQGDEALVARVDLPPERLAAGRPRAEWIAGPRLLDLDDVGAEVGQHDADERAGDHPRQIEHAEARERSLRRRCRGFAVLHHQRPATCGEIPPAHSGFRLQAEFSAGPQPSA